MYVALTCPFNIVQHKLSHIVEQCKLDSLATPNNIVWSTVTSCWTNNVRQFDPNLTPFTANSAVRRALVMNNKSTCQTCQLMTIIVVFLPSGTDQNHRPHEFSVLIFYCSGNYAS